jgi:flavodoxin
MKVLVVYESIKGKTQKFAKEIANKIKEKNHQVELKSIQEASEEDIKNNDMIFLGTWTSGKFLFNQKPEKPWVDFTSKLPETEEKKTVLFTTYNIRTGSMFKNMKKHILPKGYKVIGSMKSRNGKLDYYSDIILKYSVDYQKVA